MNTREIQPVVFATAEGATIISLSPHPFKLSSGEVLPSQSEEVVSLFTLKRLFTPMPAIAGMGVNKMQLVLEDHQLLELKKLCKMADLVILPFPVLQALREQGIRDEFPNAVAFNATVETQRSPPDQKVVDLNNWSY